MTGRPLRLGFTVAVAALALAAGGCSKDQADSSAPSPSATPSSSPSGTADPNPCHHLKPATGPAADKFGAAPVTSAECEMSLLTLEGSFLPRLMQATTFTKADFAPFRAYLTPVARRAWDRDVAKVSTSGTRDRSAFNALLSLTYLDLARRRYTLGNSENPQPVSNRKLSSGRIRLISVRGKPRLRVSLLMSFTLNLTERAGGRPVTVDGQKAVAYTLAPNPGGAKDKPFLIDGWRGRSRFGAVKPVSAGQ